MKLTQFKKDYMGKFNNQLLDSLHVIEQERLKEAMLYSLSNGGKQVRPLLLLSVIHAFGQDIAKGVKPAMALEYIHTYSLIHDDLPAMDNDDYRRGQLTSHKQFDEATAILAGDSLLTMAFDLLAQTSDNSEIILSLVKELSACAGARGMIAGQMNDILAENRRITLEELVHIHKQKTGQLIRFAIVAGSTLCRLSFEVHQLLLKFADCFGLAFQIHNDLKDVEQDKLLNKSTYVSLLGEESAKTLLKQEIHQARACISEIKSICETFDSELILDFLQYVEFG